MPVTSSMRLSSAIVVFLEDHVRCFVMVAGGSLAERPGDEEEEHRHHDDPVSYTHLDVYKRQEGLRAELARSEEFHPGHAVAAAHAALRSEIPFLDRDRAMDGEVATAVRLVESGKLLDAARVALSS